MTRYLKNSPFVYMFMKKAAYGIKLKRDMVYHILATGAKDINLA
jgi:hypothetical protein